MIVGKLIVRVYRAENLAAADLNGKSDPYIVMKLVNQTHRTSTQYKTLNPIWEETFCFDVFDINEKLDFTVWDEDRHGADFLGRLSIPLLSIQNKRKAWYQLKDKKLQNYIKSKILLRLDVDYSIPKAGIRVFTPSEALTDPPAPALKRSVMTSNFTRTKIHIMSIVDTIKYIQTCFEWTHKLRSFIAFLIFLITTYHFEMWMAPFGLLLLFVYNFVKLMLNKIDLKSINETILNSDTCKDEDQFLIQTNNKLNELNHQTLANSPSNGSDNQGEVDKSLIDKIQAVQDIVIYIQDILGHVASYFERLSNTFKFKVPFLSYLMMVCLSVVTILLYLVPIRWIVLVYGIHKFTRKLRNPNALDNNELIDFLSRVPDNSECVKHHNIITINQTTETTLEQNKSNFSSPQQQQQQNLPNNCNKTC